MGNKNYIIRENSWLDAILMARYIQRYVVTAIGLKNDEEHREVVG